MVGGYIEDAFARATGKINGGARHRGPRLQRRPGQFPPERVLLGQRGFEPTEPKRSHQAGHAAKSGAVNAHQRLPGMTVQNKPPVTTEVYAHSETRGHTLPKWQNGGNKAIKSDGSVLS